MQVSVDLLIKLVWEGDLFANSQLITEETLSWRDFKRLLHWSCIRRGCKL